MGSQNDKAEIFRRFIEKECLEIVRELLKDGKVPQKRVQEIAKYVLSVIKPEMSLDELYKVVIKFDDNYPELTPVVFKVMKEYEEKHEKKAIELVSDLVRQKKFDKAQDMVKRVLEFKSIQ